jgi:CspA family cold shock protein
VNGWRCPIVPVENSDGLQIIEAPRFVSPLNVLRRTWGDHPPKRSRHVSSERTICSVFLDVGGMLVDFSWRGNVATGTVKWFNATKGYGFIQPQGGGPDVFVHISAVEQAGLQGLNEGQKVDYELTTGRNGKVSAEDLKTK